MFGTMYLILNTKYCRNAKHADMDDNPVLIMLIWAVQIVGLADAFGDSDSSLSVYYLVK